MALTFMVVGIRESRAPPLSRTIGAGIACIPVGARIAVNAVEDRAFGQRGGGATGDGLALAGGISGAELRIDDLADRRRRDERRWRGSRSDGRGAACLARWLGGRERGRSGNRRARGNQGRMFMGQ